MEHTFLVSSDKGCTQFTVSRLPLSIVFKIPTSPVFLNDLQKRRWASVHSSIILLCLSSIGNLQRVAALQGLEGLNKFAGVHRFFFPLPPPPQSATGLCQLCFCPLSMPTKQDLNWCRLFSAIRPSSHPITASTFSC